MTDYDVGVHGAGAVSSWTVARVFAENNERLRTLLLAAVPNRPAARGCVFRTRSRRRASQPGHHRSFCYIIGRAEADSALSL